MLLHRLALATLLVIVVSTAAMAQPSTQWRTKSADDRFQSAAQRDAMRTMRSYASCIARNREDVAEEMVLSRYGSGEQDNLAARIIRPADDKCLRGFADEVRMRVTYRALANYVSQALVLKEYPNLPALVSAHTVDPPQENARLATLAGGEVFGRCIMRRNPPTAWALISSLPMSSEEEAAVAGLKNDMSECLSHGSTLELNVPSLRGMIGVAAYRLAGELRTS
jgi:type II secretory pathway pseudopilin PulG